MTAKEFYENGGYEHTLAEYDEGGYLGIDNSVAIKMLEEYAKELFKYNVMTQKIIEDHKITGGYSNWVSEDDDINEYVDNCVDHLMEFKKTIPKFKDWLQKNFTKVTKFYYDRKEDDQTFSIKEIEWQYIMKFKTNIQNDRK